MRRTAAATFAAACVGILSAGAVTLALAVEVRLARRAPPRPRLERPPSVPAPHVVASSWPVPSPAPEALPAERPEPEVTDEPHLTPQEERARVVAALEASGPGGQEQLPAMRLMSDAWLAAARERGLEVELTDWRCFARGCAITYAHTDEAALVAFAGLASASAPFSTWPGAKFESGAVTRPDGRFEATLLLAATQ